eukprot:GFYU01019594.1.p2 GENE.GFYU01019594.1~~GFYU01019594.1.p2  ORF type:complete len:134 (+),score=31.49 GFYU01019594.1:676-1077(+)
MIDCSKVNDGDSGFAAENSKGQSLHAEEVKAQICTLEANNEEMRTYIDKEIKLNDGYFKSLSQLQQLVDNAKRQNLVPCFTCGHDFPPNLDQSSILNKFESLIEEYKKLGIRPAMLNKPSVPHGNVSPQFVSQ